MVSYALGVRGTWLIPIVLLGTWPILFAVMLVTCYLFPPEYEVGQAEPQVYPGQSYRDTLYGSPDALDPSPIPTDAEPLRPTILPGHRSCPVCGTVIPRRALRCRGCGVHLSALEQHRTYSIEGVAIALFFVALGIGVGWIIADALGVGLGMPAAIVIAAWCAYGLISITRR